MCSLPLSRLSSGLLICFACDVIEQMHDLPIKRGEIRRCSRTLCAKNHIAVFRQMTFIPPAENAKTTLNLIAHDGMPHGVSHRQPQSARVAIAVAAVSKSITVTVATAAIAAITHRRRILPVRYGRIRLFLGSAVLRGPPCKRIMSNDVRTGHTVAQTQNTDELIVLFQSLHASSKLVKMYLCNAFRRAGSGAQNLAALGATTIDQRAAGASAHALTETVLHMTTTIIRLERSLHCSVLLFAHHHGVAMAIHGVNPINLHVSLNSVKEVAAQSGFIHSHHAVSKGILTR